MMNIFYNLNLKDGSVCRGMLIPNELIKEKVWKTKDGFVFEDAVASAEEMDYKLKTSILDCLERL